MNIDKALLLRKNETDKMEIIQNLKAEKIRLLKKYLGMIDEFHEASYIEKFFYLTRDMPILSVCKSPEVEKLFMDLALPMLESDYFVDAKTIFKSLDELQERSNICLIYRVIWDWYMLYLNTFFFKPLAECLEFDLEKEFNKLSRLERNGNLPTPFIDQHKHNIGIKRWVERVAPEIVFPVYENRIGTTIKKHINKFYNTDFCNLYKLVKTANEEIMGEEFLLSQFKCDFFDLASIFFKGWNCFDNKEEMESTYGEKDNNTYKLKMINSRLRTCSNLVP